MSDNEIINRLIDSGCFNHDGYHYFTACNGFGEWIAKRAAIINDIYDIDDAETISIFRLA